MKGQSQGNRVARGADHAKVQRCVRETPQVLRLAAGALLQAHRTAGERRAGSHIPGDACSGQAFSGGELLRDTEQESECRAHRTLRCARPPAF